MNFIWKSALPKRDYVVLESFQVQDPKFDKGHTFDALLYTYKSKSYFYLVYQGSAYFDINVEYLINIYGRNVEGVYQFSQFSKDFGFEIFSDNTSHNKDDITINLDISIQDSSINPFTGLRNLGATCYLNSFIQSLFFISKFRYDIFNCAPEGRILFLQRILFNMSSGREMVDPTEFVVNMVEDVHLHQDIHEFSKIFFDILEKECKPIKDVSDDINDDLNDICDDIKDISDDLNDISDDRKDISDDIKEANTTNKDHDNKDNIKDINTNNKSGKELVESLIQGHVVNFINADCGCKREIKESFQDIQVEIRDFCNNKLASNLQDSLKSFTKVETLDGDNKYKCDTHGLVRAEKGVLFSDLPPVLFVLLKRFSMDFETGESHKINDFFEFPEKLDLTEFCIKKESDYKDDINKLNDNYDTNKMNDNKDDTNKMNDHKDDTNKMNDHKDDINKNYKLYSVIVHKGGPEEGHFYAYLEIKGQWYKFNDNVVTRVPREEALLNNYGGKHPLFKKKRDFSAYYLIYIRSDNTNNLNSDNTNNIKLDDINSDNIRSNNINSDNTKLSYINNDVINIPHSVLSEINKQNIKRDIKCVSYKNIKNYRGVGFCNLDSYDFPLTGYQEFSISETDTVQVLKNKVSSRQEVYFFNIKDSRLEYITNNKISDNIFLYKNNEVIDFSKSYLAFIKIYKDEYWAPDTFPENLHLAFISVISGDYKEIRRKMEESVRIPDFEIYVEDPFNKTVRIFNSSSNDNINSSSNDNINSSSNNNDSSSSSNDNLYNGIILILVEKSHSKAFSSFYSDFSTRMCINLIIDSLVCIPLFLPSNLESKLLNKRVRDYLGNEEVEVEALEPVILEYLPLERNMVNLDIKDNKIIYLGLGDIMDYNCIRTVSPYAVRENMTLRDFYKLVLLKMTHNDVISNINNLRIVDTVKDTLFLKSYTLDEVFTSEGMNIIQSFDSPKYLKVAYFTGKYEIKGYPFYIFTESETTGDLRKEFRISERVVKYDKEGYTDLDEMDVISEYGEETFILIERRY